MECTEAASVAVVQVARPPASSVTVPKMVEPSLKETLPVATPLPGAVIVTTAVNVTNWLYTAGFKDELTPVTVAALFTTSGAELPVLPAHPDVPVNVAVIVWLPTARAAVLNDA